MKAPIYCSAIVAMACTAVAMEDPVVRNTDEVTGTLEVATTTDEEDTEDGFDPGMDPATFCLDLPEKDVLLPCPAEVLALGEADTHTWCWVFADGVANCGLDPNKTVEMRDMMVDVSCGVSYDLNGFPDKEQPDPAYGDPAVVARSSVKLHIESDGKECKVTESCCDQSPLWR